MMNHLEQLEQEMAYTDWEHSCKDPHTSWAGDLKQCRRAKGHEGRHAVGFASSGTLYLWGTVECTCTEAEVTQGCQVHDWRAKRS